MRALKTYPIKFNDTTLFRPDSWQESYGRISQINSNEFGEDLEELKRVGKLTVSCQLSCTSEWLAVIQGFSILPSFTLQKYDAITNGYKSYTVRMDNFTVDTEIHSDYITQSTGLYNAAFTLIEF